MSFRKITEEDSLYNNIENKTVKEILIDINNEDQKVALAVKKVIPEIEKLVSLIVPKMQEGGRIFYIDAGTSGRLGILDASEIPPTFGIDQSKIIGIIAGGEKAIRTAVENAEDDCNQGWADLRQHKITEKDTVIGIAASGTTPYVISALHQARLNGILTACITSNQYSPLSKESDIAIETIVGPEYITGSSRMKSGSAQKMVLNMISTSVMIKLGRVKDNKMINMQLNNKKLIDRGIRILEKELKINYKEAENLLSLKGSLKKAMESSKKDV